MNTYTDISSKKPHWRAMVLRFIGPDVINFLSLFFAACGLIGGLATYLILSGLTPIVPNRDIIWFLFGLNIFMITGLLAVVGTHIIRLIRRRQRGVAGAELHARLVFLFSIIASVPAVLVATFAIVTLDRGLDSWFSERTKSIISNTTAVANAYLTEHREGLRREVLTIERDLVRAWTAIDQDPRRLDIFLTAQAGLRSISKLIILDASGTIHSSSPEQPGSKNAIPPQEVFTAAQNGKPVIITIGALAQVQVLQKLSVNTKTPLYMLGTRFVSPNVLEHLSKTDTAVREYGEMEDRRFEAQITFAMIYIVIALIILLSAIWFGLWIADRLVKPISSLIWATQRMSQGDLGVRVADKSDDEMGRLGKMFNTMAVHLGKQQKELIDARDDLNERHRFTEMVLNSASAGILGVDENGHISHANPAAGKIFHSSAHDLIGQSFEKLLPEVTPLIHDAKGQPGRNIQITRRTSDGEDHLLRLSISQNTISHGTNIVMSLDDVTDLVAYQRTAAWADIARRIAHEIKNPLTPIQLSAERLHRKYRDQIQTDTEAFDQCTNTIIRQVGDIGRMVDEFSSFARMPSAVMDRFDLTDVVSQSIFLLRMSNTNIHFKFENPGPIEAEGDHRLISQALTNTIKNAIEAISRNTEENPQVIEIELAYTDENCIISISDTGPGWPRGDRMSLLEPYKTSRVDGTGLGLAIVKKIVEDHGGRILMEDAEWFKEKGYGAKFIIDIPRYQPLKTISNAEGRNGA
jgi:two-component system, NtrC family, nitrogen regulation sensor histidine kinase NtrY